MRLIDADKLETHEQLELFESGNYEYVEVVYKDDIDDAPTIEPERKKGKWIENKYMYYCCSECEHEAYWDADCTCQKLFDYCPYCGAEMTRGE